MLATDQQEMAKLRAWGICPPIPERSFSSATHQLGADFNVAAGGPDAIPGVDANGEVAAIAAASEGGDHLDDPDSSVSPRIRRTGRSPDKSEYNRVAAQVHREKHARRSLTVITQRKEVHSRWTLDDERGGADALLARLFHESELPPTRVSPLLDLPSSAHLAFARRFVVLAPP